ncbi:unnamed protein product, partial [Symbiodinium microadriaticum]
MGAGVFLPMLTVEVAVGFTSESFEFMSSSIGEIKTISFLGLAVLVAIGFRWLELLLGTGPKGFDLGLRNFVIYFASPAEVLFDGAGRLKASPDGLVSELLFRIAKHMLLGTIVLSIGKATSFAPFLESGADAAT